MKYQIIYADPPWKYGGTGASKWKPAKDYYPVLSFNEIKALDIESIADTNCLLFMWVVNPELKRCIEVGESWGFKYITVGFIWYKERANVGNYTMPQCELLLIFKKGKIPSDRIRNPGIKSFYSHPITKHSEKPNEFRTRIMNMYPKSNKIELFARQKVIGWHSWGNEIDNDIIINKTYIK